MAFWVMNCVGGVNRGGGRRVCRGGMGGGVQGWIRGRCIGRATLWYGNNQL